MIIVVAVLAVVVSVPLAGGSLRRILELDLGHLWIIGLAFTLQVMIINVFPDALRHTDAVRLHLYTYGLAVAFLLLNRRVRGFALLGLGTVLNLLPIAANSGVMPASAWALRVAGRATSATKFANSGAVPHARLAFLGDVMAVPHSLPLANVFSVGDIVLVVGTAVTLHCACGTRLARMLGWQPVVTAPSTVPGMRTFADGSPVRPPIEEHGNREQRGSDAHPEQQPPAFAIGE